MSLVTFTLGSYWGVMIRRTGACEEVAEKIAERPPQAIIVDGDILRACTLAEELRESGIPVIVINDSDGAALAAGAFAAIEPPFQPDRLRAALEQATS
jgi:DNA-binding NtrC family response regulator